MLAYEQALKYYIIVVIITVMIVLYRYIALLSTADRWLRSPQQFLDVRLTITCKQ